MPATKKRAVRRSTARKPAAKKPAGRAVKTSAAKKAAGSPARGQRGHAKHVRERLHGAIRRAPQSVSEKEFEETTAALLAIVVELAAETALVFGEVLARLDSLERRSA